MYLLGFKCISVSIYGTNKYVCMCELTENKPNFTERRTFNCICFILKHQKVATPTLIDVSTFWTTLEVYGSQD